LWAVVVVAGNFVAHDQSYPIKKGDPSFAMRLQEQGDNPVCYAGEKKDLLAELPFAGANAPLSYHYGERGAASGLWFSTQVCPQ
jgi:hypothetical protein